LPEKNELLVARLATRAEEALSRACADQTIVGRENRRNCRRIARDCEKSSGLS
jgi:hypothetical protein